MAQQHGQRAGATLLTLNDDCVLAIMLQCGVDDLRAFASAAHAFAAVADTHRDPIYKALACCSAATGLRLPAAPRRLARVLRPPGKGAWPAIFEELGQLALEPRVDLLIDGARCWPDVRTGATVLHATSDDGPNQSAWEVLRPDHSFWSSVGSADADAVETLTFRLVQPLCVVTGVAIAPYKALYQYNAPVYAPRRVRVRLRRGYPGAFVHAVARADAEKRERRLAEFNGAASFEAVRALSEGWDAEDLAHPGAGDPYGGVADADADEFWDYTSPFFVCENIDETQLFPLAPDLAVGGIVRLELHGRHMTEPDSAKWFTVLRRVRVFGLPLASLHGGGGGGGGSGGGSGGDGVAAGSGYPALTRALLNAAAPPSVPTPDTGAARRFVATMKCPSKDPDASRVCPYHSTLLPAAQPENEADGGDGGVVARTRASLAWAMAGHLGPAMRRACGGPIAHSDCRVLGLPQTPGWVLGWVPEEASVRAFMERGRADVPTAPDEVAALAVCRHMLHRSMATRCAASRAVRAKLRTVRRLVRRGRVVSAAYKARGDREISRDVLAAAAGVAELPLGADPCAIDVAVQLRLRLHLAGLSAENCAALVPRADVVSLAHRVEAGEAAQMGIVGDAHDVADQLLAVFAGATRKAGEAVAAPGSLVGQQVRIHGIVSKPQLNDTRGEATGWVADRGRYAVTLEYDGSTAMMTPANLCAVVATGAESSADLGAVHPHVPFSSNGDLVRVGDVGGGVLAATPLRSMCRRLGGRLRDAESLALREKNHVLAYFIQLHRVLRPLLAKETSLGLAITACFRFSLAESNVFSRVLVAVGDPGAAVHLLRNGTMQGSEAFGDELLLDPINGMRDRAIGLAVAVFSASNAPNRIAECLLKLGRVNELVDYLLQLRFLRFVDVPAMLAQTLAAHPGRPHVALRLGLRLLGPLGGGDVVVTPQAVAQGLRLFRGSGAAVGANDLGELVPPDERDHGVMITTAEVTAAIHASPYFE